MNSYLRLLVFFALASFAYGEFPPFVKVCRRDSDINECVKENILIAKKYVKKGIPKLFVMPTNPFTVTNLTLENPVLKMYFSQFDGFGMDEFDVNDLKIDLENNIFDIDMIFPRVEGSLSYIFDGKLIAIQLNSQGIAHGNMTEMNLKISLRGTRFEQNGKPYIKFDDKKVNLRFDKGYAYFDDLFPSRELTEITNRVFNNNMKEFVYELQPLFEETFAFVITDCIMKLFEKFSIDELFPL